MLFKECLKNVTIYIMNVYYGLEKFSRAQLREKIWQDSYGQVKTRLPTNLGGS